MPANARLATIIFPLTAPLSWRFVGQLGNAASPCYSCWLTWLFGTIFSAFQVTCQAPGGPCPLGGEQERTQRPSPSDPCRAGRLLLGIKSSSGHQWETADHQLRQPKQGFTSVDFNPTMLLTLLFQSQWAAVSHRGHPWFVVTLGPAPTKDHT